MPEKIYEKENKFLNQPHSILRNDMRKIRNENASQQLIDSAPIIRGVKFDQSGKLSLL